MAKRIDYEGVVGQTFTNKKGQTYKVVEYCPEDNKHLYNVVFIDPQKKSYKTVINSTVKYTAVTREQKKQMDSEPPARYKRIAGLKDKTILAIDGATHITGLALYANKKIATCKISAYGNDTIVRIDYITELINKVIETSKVEVVYYEEPLLKNKEATFTLGALMKAVESLVKSKGIEFIKIVPSSWKAYCGCKGERTEQKKQSIERASRLMGRTMGEDEADAYNMLTYCLDNLEAG